MGGAKRPQNKLAPHAFLPCSALGSLGDRLRPRCGCASLASARERDKGNRMTSSARTYEEAYASFRWRIPERFNIAEAACDRHVGSNNAAIIFETNTGISEMTFEHLQEQSRRLANALSAHGVVRGDRIGILLPQCPETVIAHLAAYRLGAIALPLFTLFGPDAIEYRLKDSGAKAVVSNAAGIEELLGVADRLNAPPLLISIEDRRDGGVLDWTALIAGASADHTGVD